ncbi:hypothetical protein HOT99_gp149 [Caulobacter phage CcrBL10]|uniref:Uncharacterized protein n=1 Tax=Caulobacter phage CcrBL10 TaxID=2283269 RepID=A0A385ECK3_9CAUD|nr:hypothetical protein HOT99_gp149 [Caulobacter phage CcrBL10]AXQ68468.1 hypothetical protein CcrBL10_gp264 [Caulobacter phage CcrBL10]
MQILTFAEFIAMPDGVLYQEVTEYGSPVAGLAIRHSVLYDGDRPFDFIYEEVLARTADGEMDAPLILEGPGTARWGLFDYDLRYIVYEEADRKALAAKVLG